MNNVNFKVIEEAWFKPKKDKIKTLEEIGYECDKSCDGILYYKWVEEDNIDYNIQIHIEKNPITFMKTKTEGVFNPNEPAYITCEELEAIYNKIQELKKEMK